MNASYPLSRPRRSALVTLLTASLLTAAACRRSGDGDLQPTASAPSAVLSHGPTHPTAPVGSMAAGQTGSASAPTQPPPPPPPLVELSADGPFEVIDLHVDTPYQVHMKGRAVSLPEGHATLARLASGHYAGIVYPIYIPDYLHDNKPTVADADAILAIVHRIIAAHDELVAVGSEPVPADRIAAFIAIEGAGAFADDIAQIDRFISAGVRLVGPVHAHDNALATSATGMGSGRGLSDVGKRFCRRVYAKGALVDVSHMSDPSFADLASIAEELHLPIVATHSNARAVASAPRNLTDEQLRRIAASGGVAGLNLHRDFVKLGGATTADAVAMVRHMVKVAGIDHVAIGSDFDGGNPVSGLDHAGRMQALAEALRKAGFEPGDVRKIFGLNALRMLDRRPQSQ